MAAGFFQKIKQFTQKLATHSSPLYSKPNVSDGGKMTYSGVLNKVLNR